MKPNPLSSSNHLTLPNAISSPLENDYSSPASTSRGEPTVKEPEPGNESADADRNGARRPRERRALTAALTHYAVRTCVSTDLFFLQHLESWIAALESAPPASISALSGDQSRAEGKWRRRSSAPPFRRAIEP